MGRLALCLVLVACDGAEPASESLSESIALVDGGLDAALAQRIRVVVRFEVSSLAAASARRLDDPRERQRVADAIDRAAAALIARLPASAVVARRFHFVEALALWIDPAELSALRQLPGVRAVSLDPGGGSHMDEAGPLGGFPIVQTLGFTGAGRRVAVIDTGLRQDHVDFAGRLVDEACFCTGCCPSGADTQLGTGAATDDAGHGTNTTGIVAGAGTAAPRGGAPGVGIVAVKVVDSHNRFCCASDIVAGLDWVLATHPEVDAVNASLGTDALFAGTCDAATAWTDTLATAIDSLRSAGILTTVSAGNQGASDEMAAPACIRESIAVSATWDGSYAGAVDAYFCADVSPRVDQITCYANVSTALDLFAPGSPITSTGMDDSRARSTFNGTSQAAPQVAACIAAMRQARPRSTATELASALSVSSVHIALPVLGGTRPRLRCDLALDALLAVCGDGRVTGIEQCDDGAANGSTECGCGEDCTYPSRGDPCTTGVIGPCDAPDQCDGSGACTEHFAAFGLCRASAGPCDLDEYCDGTSAECPPDRFVAEGRVCGASRDCSVPGSCTGLGPACPPDEPIADGSPCGDDNACNGTETCESGTCVSGVPVDCDDRDPCTADSCSELTGGCTRSRIDGCCQSDADCAGREHCLGARCTAPDAAMSVVDAAMTLVDASRDVDASAPAIDAGMRDGSVVPIGRGGCGCRVTGLASRAAPAFALLLLVWRKRRLARARRTFRSAA